MAPKNTKNAKTSAQNIPAFTSEEKAAARERMQELKAAARQGSHAGKGAGESDVLAKISAMSPADRALAERLHALVKAAAPGLAAKTWYGMPAYANQQGQVVCFFQDSRKFKTRYATLGFSDKARLDEGRIWPTSYALTDLTAADEAKITTLLKKAVN